MTTACRYEGRVDGVISIDSAPIDLSNLIFSEFRFVEFTYKVYYCFVLFVSATSEASYHFATSCHKIFQGSSFKNE